MLRTRKPIWSYQEPYTILIMAGAEYWPDSAAVFDGCPVDSNAGMKQDRGNTNPNLLLGLSFNVPFQWTGLYSQPLAIFRVAGRGRGQSQLISTPSAVLKQFE